MNVASLIEWLQTMPQDATVTVLSHSDGHGYYMQGGSCTTEDFHNHIEYMGNALDRPYQYGVHFELSTDKDGKATLQLGVMNK